MSVAGRLTLFQLHVIFGPQCVGSNPFDFGVSEDTEEGLGEGLGMGPGRKERAKPGEQRNGELGQRGEKGTGIGEQTPGGGEVSGISQTCGSNVIQSHHVEIEANEGEETNKNHLARHDSRDRHCCKKMIQEETDKNE
ncbi:hypothetical protein TWF970_008776 [Orbilia oligospora]|uniref:Uncharacterized protein n=1 Tax=Orbilia oligospora TaxID=2813651 RepID=A0A7C8RLQ2_ORBOL|nr:hypothetical protein TWF970_008776 [Orbilia oligospora]